ncbi:phage holin family protein [Arthrobacter sp. H35-D1]|uniref:phage holin family protein n=1 Tax=Arthrobacter sp. H35-D1 TaxID=3046202 RepID=UPI0024BB63C6|nr:phage holin family protein [Arthrobacter sp. H35-D1]MDJ0311985.1 phage holin family protein [Arthrobacter sp. H35-D1]
MRRFVIHIVINALALWLASWVLPGLQIASTSIVGSDVAGVGGTANTINVVLAYLFIGLVFGLVNAVVKPIVKLLSLPVTILTLGLFTIIINAAMLWLTAWVSTFTPIQFTIDDFFWTAILAALIISFVSMLTSTLGKSTSRR